MSGDKGFEFTLEKGSGTGAGLLLRSEAQESSHGTCSQKWTPILLVCGEVSWRRV
jgi:hypothetical protein